MFLALSAKYAIHFCYLRILVFDQSQPRVRMNIWREILMSNIGLWCYVQHYDVYYSVIAMWCDVPYEDV